MLLVKLALYSSSNNSNANSLEQLSLEEELAVDQLRKPPARFAIANPDTAPYGKAAKEALTHLGSVAALRVSVDQRYQYWPNICSIA